MRTIKIDIAKPEFGAKCNRCGYCCASTACSIGEDIFGATPDKPCPALEKSAQGQAACGLVVRPYYYLAMAAGNQKLAQQCDAGPQTADEYALASSIADTLGVGVGCDAMDDPRDSHLWPWPVVIEQRLDGRGG